MYPLSVLYVDDEPKLLEIGKLFLERSGDYTVATCESAVEAMKLIPEDAFDVIVSDYMMPECNGIQFLKYLREHGDQTPFIIFTGKGREEVVIEAFENGADFYLQKGGDPKAQFAELHKKIEYAASRRRSEIVLRESEAYYRTIFANTGTASAILEDDTMISLANEEFANLSGYSLSEIEGKKSWIGFVAREDLERMLAQHKLRRKEKDLAKRRYEFRFVRKGGEVRDILLYIDVIPGTKKSIASLLDITDRKRAEVELQAANEELKSRIETIARQNQELHAAYQQLATQEVELRHNYEELERGEALQREADTRYRLIVETAQEGILQVDDRNRTVFVNRSMAEMLGYTALEMTGMNVLDFIPEDEQADHDALTGIRRKGELKRCERSFIRKDGSTFRAHLSVTPIIDDQARYQGFFAMISREMSDRKLAEAALRRTNETLERQTRTLNILNEVITTANSARDLPSLLQKILAVTLSLLDYDAGGVYIIDRAAGTATVTSSINIPREFLDVSGTVPLNQAPYEALFVRGVPIFTDHYEKISPGHAHMTGFYSIASIPLVSGDRIIGALNCASRRRHVISEDERETLVSIGQELGTTIERIAAEEAAKLAATNLEILFNSIDEMVFILDMDGRIIWVNETVKKNLQYDQDELVGMDILSLHAPEQREAVQQIFRAMVAGEVDSCTLPVQSKSKKRIEVETKVNSGRWNNRKVLIGVSRDVTERKVVEGALRESNAYLNSLISHANVPIIVWDTNYTITRFNHAFEDLTGIPATEAIGKNLQMLFPKDSRDSSMTLIHQATQQGEWFKSVEIPIRHRSGGIRIVAWNSAQIMDSDGVTLRSVIAQGHDITEQRRMEGALREANKKLNLLSSITRHDILNHIMVVQGYLDFAEELSTDPVQVTHLKSVKRAVSAIQRHITFTREYEELGVRDPEWLSLDRLLKKIDDSGLPIRSDCNGVSVYADPMLEKVFSNLMDNTLRYAEGATAVRVGCKPNNTGLVITWEDDGPGISADQKEKIFSRGVGKNTGLGLFLAREILAITGISIKETGEQGKGARFEIEVPAGMFRE